MSHLILVRHGQSEWNLENKFTGWVDIDLSERGEVERWKGGINKEKLSTEIKESIIEFKEGIEEYRNNNKSDK